MTIKLRLPYPPSVNHGYFNRVVIVPRGRSFVQRGVSKAGKMYFEQVIAHLREAHGVYSKSEGRFRLAVVATMPDRRKRDLDNALKFLIDSLSHAGVWHDDEQIDEITISRGPVQKPGWVDVTITKLANDAGAST